MRFETERRSSALFEELSRGLLSSGHQVQFRAHGRSMTPLIQDGEMLRVEGVLAGDLHLGDIIVVKTPDGLRAHRLVSVELPQNSFCTRGDAGQEDDPAVGVEQILGRAVAKEETVDGKTHMVRLCGTRARMRSLVRQSRNAISRSVRHIPFLMGARMLLQKRAFGVVGLFLLLAGLLSAQAVGQVAVDASTNGIASVTAAAPTVTVNHTTAGANRLLVVGVSINLAPSTGTTVSGVTYNGIPLTQVIAHNDAGPTRRAEIWYLVAPPTGTNLPVVVTCAGVTATQGVVVGATTFTGADQILPIRASAFANGTTSPTGVTVTSAVGDMVLDTLAIQGNQTATAVAGQTQQWTNRSGNNGNPAVRGFGSTQAGAATPVLMSETLSAATNWSQVAVSIRFAVPATAVAIDATTSGGGDVTGATPNVTFAHTTAGANRLLVVGVSINITNNAAATVTGVTYNGVALTQAGARNDAGATRRIEMWYLVAPPVGTFNVVVNLSALGATTVGVVSGATTFTGVDQTVPVRPFLSADGPATACSTGVFCSQLNVASGPGEVVIDTLAIAGNVTPTVTAPQAPQWGRTSLAANANPDVYGLGSTRTGAASVPLSETFSAASTWSMGALSVRPLQADLSVTVAGTSAFNPANLTYTVTVTNNGTSSATGVVLNDVLASGMTFVSATPSTGTCSGTAPISCALGTLASGASATVTVVGTPTARGGYPNTASVTSGVPDYNMGNNSNTGLAFSQVNACTGAQARNPALVPLTGVVNTYFPVTTSVASGATSITNLGVATGAATPIAAGELLLVIQMQDAAISSTNDSTYGDGVSGAGSTNLNNAGVYEYVTATNAVPLVGIGKTLTISGAGPGGGLIYSYTNANATATQGQRRFQVVRLPSSAGTSGYSTATLGAGLTAAPWNGTTGGILALDLSGTLTLNGATVSVDGLGFRGGAGLQLNGNAAATNADYWFTSPAAYTGTAVAGADGSKGEGTAGTPLWVESGGTFLNTGSGYPSGTAGTDGSMAKGAPGNAGGGGTDGNPAANDQNSGGGGGGNGGNGGSGGNSWNTNLSNGGLGGDAFPASVGRVVLGGGGGAGTRNNSDGLTLASAGAAGGGIVIIRAGGLSGTATITANGAAAADVTANDSGGGGGAGGSIVILSATGGENGLTLSTQGGKGGDAWDAQAFSIANRHGPGGGGGGGVVLLTGAAASAPNTTGGANGVTLNPGVPYGATSGAAGLTQTNALFNQQPGSQPGAECVPDLTITKTNAPSSFVRGQTGTYTLTVTNISTGPTASTAGTVTVVDTLPAGLTATAISGTGWACTLVTLTCTNATVLGPGLSYPAITVSVNVLQTAANSVTNTATVSGGSEVVTSNDTATDPTPVVSSADLAITKTASPTQPMQGNAVTYTLSITNNGPSNSTNVVVTDTLPTTYVSYVSATPTQGTCSQAVGVVTCNLGALNSGVTATITIVVTASVQTGASSAVNTASMTATEPDPNSANNTATATITIISPTQVGLESFTAEAGTQGIVLRWTTGGEIHNLGFNLYRERNGERIRLNPTLVAGSALMMRSQIEQHGGKSYAWIVPAGTPASVYWLEDLDLNGGRTLHGPVSPSLIASSARAAVSPMLSEVSATQAESQSRSHVVEFVPPRRTPVTSPQMQKQFQLAAHPAIKIMVGHEGWYRVTQPELVAAGLNPNVDPRHLQLFAEAIEQPILVSGANPGFGGFGPNAAIEFYGTGLDTPFTGTRVYWLIAGNLPGLRIHTSGDLPGNAGYPQQFTEKVELRDRTTYFAALITPDDNNFFGALVSTSPVDQVLQTPHILTTAGWTPRMLVVLRGVGEGVPHDVTVALNGVSLGNISFTGQVRAQLRVDLPPGLLQEGANTVTLTAQDGDSDISLVDYIDITYPHSFVADHDQLKFSLRAGEPVRITGFQSTSIHVFDITNAAQPVELATRITSQSGSTTMQAQVPFWPAGQHTLLALAEDDIAKPAQLVPNQPSHWNNPQPGSKVVVITHPAFADALAPLVALRRQQGRTVSVVSIDDVYDEFSFGEHSPQSIRDFLATAAKNWKTAPSYLLLAGDASVDPRNFLGFGDFDFVPTRIIPTSQLMTASDDWFSDFNNTGLPALSTGRLPVRTAEDANTVVAKIVGYETGNDSGAWTRQALVVADRNDADDFTSDSQAVAALLPSTLQVSNVFATNLDPGTARADVLNALNSGELLVNYMGHGSVEVWSGENLLNSTTAAALTNAPRLPVFLVIDCLNGFFHDVYTRSLAETLLLNSQGGAVAVVASSGLTDATPQAHLDRSLVQALFQKDATLGDALVRAKSTINSQDVRRTYVLFGDPLLRLKPAAPQN